MKKKKIIVDLDVWNCHIRAFKPEIQTFMPNDDVRKMIFFETTEAERIIDTGHKRLRRIWQHRDRSG